MHHFLHYVSIFLCWWWHKRNSVQDNATKTSDCLHSSPQGESGASGENGAPGPMVCIFLDITEKISNTKCNNILKSFPYLSLAYIRDLVVCPVREVVLDPVELLWVSLFYLKTIAGHKTCLWFITDGLDASLCFLSVWIEVDMLKSNSEIFSLKHQPQKLTSLCQELSLGPLYQFSDFTSLCKTTYVSLLRNTAIGCFSAMCW